MTTPLHSCLLLQHTCRRCGPLGECEDCDPPAAAAGAHCNNPLTCHAADSVVSVCHIKSASHPNETSTLSGQQQQTNVCIVVQGIKCRICYFSGPDDLHQIWYESV